MGYDQQCCKNCFYWRRLGGRIENMCMRFPPQVIGYISANDGTPSRYLQQAFPETSEIDWCGEYTRVKRRI